MRSTRNSTKMSYINLLCYYQCHCHNLKQLYMIYMTAIEGKLHSLCIALTKILLVQLEND